jgi:hypothetical protein
MSFVILSHEALNTRLQSQSRIHVTHEKEKWSTWLSELMKQEGNTQLETKELGAGEIGHILPKPGRILR